MDRALASEAKGPGFESQIAYHFIYERLATMADLFFCGNFGNYIVSPYLSIRFTLSQI